MQKYIIFTLLTFTMLSCQKEIKIDLNTSNPQVVIEGAINNQTNIHTIKISKTVNFSDANVYPAIKNAVVTIKDNAGNAETLKETQAGMYQTQNLKGVSGRTYTLTVITEGKTFTAQSTMPRQVPLQGIQLLKSASGFPPGSGNGYIIFPQFIDPLGENFYQFVPTVNNAPNNEVIVENDHEVDGLPNSRPLFSRNSKLKQGDTLTLQFRCLDKVVYEYFFSLDGGGGPGGGATPANPVTNIKGGALGYFSAHTMEEKKVIAQ